MGELGGIGDLFVQQVSAGDPSLTFKDEVLSDYDLLKELSNNIDKSSPVERQALEDAQNYVLDKYGSFGRFELLLSEAMPEHADVLAAAREHYSNLVEEADAGGSSDAGGISSLEDAAKAAGGLLSLEYPAEDDVARATAYGSSGGIGAYAAEPKEGSVSPVTMPKRPESRAQARSPRPIRAPGGAQLNNTDYLAVPEYMQRPDYFDFNPSAGADFTQQLLARAAEEKTGGFSNLV
tara:strand:+ start:141 stop:848 length:708 start_codon:yes stop_codon:yes gene_type:complete